jgi:hypothetical protein
VERAAGTDPAGGSLTFQVTGVGGIAAGADTAVLQVNALNATASGYLTAYAAGGSDPNVSAVAYFSDDTYRNLVYVPLSASGQSTLTDHGSAPVDVSVYARGYYMPPPTTPAGGAYWPLDAQLVYGAASAGTQLAANASATFQVTGVGDIPALGVSGVTEDVVASNPTAMGRLDEGPAGGAKQPVVSFLNADSAYAGYDNGLVSTLSPSGQETITNESSGTVNVQVAVTGWLAAAGTPAGPQSVSATVSGTSAWPGAAPGHPAGSGKPPPRDRATDPGAPTLTAQPVTELQNHQPPVALHRSGRPPQHRVQVRHERPEERRVTQYRAHPGKIIRQPQQLRPKTGLPPRGPLAHGLEHDALDPLQHKEPRPSFPHQALSPADARILHDEVIKHARQWCKAQRQTAAETPRTGKYAPSCPPERRSSQARKVGVRRGTRGQVDRRGAGDDVDAPVFACVRRVASDAEHAV